MFRPTMEDLLNIENFCHWKFNEIKINILGKLGCIFNIIEKKLTNKILWNWFSKF
jgi:hypothetical protein